MVSSQKGDEPQKNQVSVAYSDHYYGHYVLMFQLRSPEYVYEYIKHETKKFSQFLNVTAMDGF